MRTTHKHQTPRLGNGNAAEDDGTGLFAVVDGRKVEVPENDDADDVQSDGGKKQERSDVQAEVEVAVNHSEGKEDGNVVENETGDSLLGRLLGRQQMIIFILIREIDKASSDLDLEIGAQVVQCVDGSDACHCSVQKEAVEEECPDSLAWRLKIDGEELKQAFVIACSSKPVDPSNDNGEQEADEVVSSSASLGRCLDASTGIIQV